MNSPTIKDDSLLQLNNEELQIKKGRRGSSNFSPRKASKMNEILKDTVKLSKSLTKLNLKSNIRKNMQKPEKKDNIIKDYLHLHKFEIQRRNSKKKITVKQFKKFSNKSLFSNKNVNECVSMVYYRNQEKSKKSKKKLINKELTTIELEKDRKPNLKKVESFLINKLNNMKFIFETSDNFFNSNKNSNINKYNTDFKTNNCREDINHIKNTEKNSKYRSSVIEHKSKLFSLQNMNNFKTRRSLLKHRSINYDNRFSLEKMKDINKDNMKISDNKNNMKKKISGKNLVSEKTPMEKLRNLYKVQKIYDSFDDDESDKDDNEYDGGCLLPNSNYILVLDLLVFLSILYNSFYLPIRMAKYDCFCYDENIIHTIILYSVDILYIIDFSLSFFRAYYNYQLKLVKNKIKIIMNYLKTDCLFDFLEAIPIVSYSNFLCMKNKGINNCFGYNMSNYLIILKILNNIKIIKIFKVRNKQKNVTLNNFLNLFSENYLLENSIDNIINILHYFLAFNFFICLNIFLAKQTYPNWLITVNTQDESLLYNYIVSSYSLVETLTTVGYGDIVCESTFERIFQIFFLGVGVIAYSYIISSFGNLIKNERLSSIKYNEKMKILEEIRIDYPNMPYKLYNKIFNYIESRKVTDIKMDANILTDSLPFNLRNSLLLIMYSSCIKNFKFFKNVENSNFIIEVLSKFVSATGKKSKILVYEGEMIEEIIIVKDGRLSLEVAIDMEDQEASIEKYFYVNFQGITTAKEKKEIEEAKKLNISHLIYSKKAKDFDNVKTVLNNAVKKQVNNLLNDGYQENTSILDKTKNDNKKKQNKLKKTIKSEYLKNEPIKNEEGNFKYIKIIDIRKYENFGGLYMFMRRPSPLTLKVKSKFAELYLIPKKNIFEISKNYKNIWSKIHKKDFHNMLSIKHKTFITLNQYIEFNGIVNINPNEITTFDNSTQRNIKSEITTFDHSRQRNINSEKENVSRDSNNNCLSPIDVNKNNKPSPQSLFNKNKVKTIKKLTQDNLFSNKSLRNFVDNNYQAIQTEGQFSQLLSIMGNGKKYNNYNSKSNFYNLNTNNNSINTINTNDNEKQKQNSSFRSMTSNFFDERKQTNQINEKGNTIVINNKSDILLPTLNAIFNDNKVEEIRTKLKKSKQKEKRRRIFSLGKKIAKLFKNENYAIILLDKNNGESIEIGNSNNMNSTKNIISNNKMFLDNIPDISTGDEYSIHRFDYTDLSKEEVISFTLESIYKNINNHTNMKYFKNKIYQEKTLKYLTKLIDQKTRNSSDYNRELSKSSSFSYSLTSKSSKNKSSISLNSFSKNSEVLLNFSDDTPKKKAYNSERLFEIKKRRNKNKNKKKIKKNKLSEIYRDYKNLKNIGYINNKEYNLDLLNNKNHPTKSKKGKRYSVNNNIKFTFKLNYFDNTDKNSINNSIKKHHHKKLFLEDEKKMKINSDLMNNNNHINLQTIKSSKTFKKSLLSENKSRIKKKHTKRKSKEKNEQKRRK